MKALGGGGWILGHLIDGTQAEQVVIVGAGPIGLAAITTSKLFSPARIVAGRLEMPGLITHRFGLDEMQDAYDVFSRAGGTGALKVALFNDKALDHEG